MEIERQKLQMQAELERFKAELKAKTDLQIAMMQAEISKQQNEQENAMELRKLLIETQIEMKKTVEEARMAQEGEKNKVMLEGMKAMISNANKPRKVTRDESGRVSGVE
jgi:fructose/tagatose bisphosphate aldolase